MSTKARELIEQAMSKGTSRALNENMEEAIVTADGSNTRISSEDAAEIKSLIESHMSSLVDALSAKGVSASANVGSDYASVSWSGSKLMY